MICIKRTRKMSGDRSAAPSSAAHGAGPRSQMGTTYVCACYVLRLALQHLAQYPSDGSFTSVQRSRAIARLLAPAEALGELMDVLVEVKKT